MSEAHCAGRGLPACFDCLRRARGGALAPDVHRIDGRWRCASFVDGRDEMLAQMDARGVRHGDLLVPKQQAEQRPAGQGA